LSATCTSPGRLTGRLIEAYWTGFVGWLLDRTDARWRPWRARPELARLRDAALDVGEALVAARHVGPGAAGLPAAVDRFAWLLGVAARRHALAGQDLARAWNAHRVVATWLSPADGR
jgi:hypothetical protein